MLEFDFHALILHLMSSYSCVNNPVHIPANYRGDSRTVIIDKTRDLRIILFTFSIFLLKLSHELYLHLHMCSLLSLLNMCSLLCLLNMCSLLKCEYIFCNQSLSFFVILRLELQVCIMLTFIFCEINNIIYLVLIHNNTSQIYLGFKCKTSLTSSGIICIRRHIPSHFL